jgi:hypothetical protein
MVQGSGVNRASSKVNTGSVHRQREDHFNLSTSIGHGQRQDQKVNA